MTEVVVFGDVVEAFTTYLRDELDDRGWMVTVGTQVPFDRPAQLVRVLRTGGARNEDPSVPTERAQLTIEAWAATQATSHDLAQVCRALIYASRGTVDGVHRVDELSGPGYLPDDVSDERGSTSAVVPRYSFSVVVTWRGFTETGS